MSRCPWHEPDSSSNQDVMGTKERCLERHIQGEAHVSIINGTSKISKVISKCDISRQKSVQQCVQNEVLM